MNASEVKDLKVLSAKIRLDVMKMLSSLGYGHVGGSLSIVEVLSVLYGKYMRYDASNPSWDKRDMFVLSKGHAGPGLYATLANVGFFEKDMLYTLNAGGTNMPSHPDRSKTPGVDMTTGSLGQGTSVAAGIATGFKMNHTDQKVYLIVGDGELNEGQCWEAFQYIAHNKLNNCIVFIDNNKRQLDGYTCDVCNPFDIEAKMRAFGFHALSVNGADEKAIADAIELSFDVKDQAVCIILDTIKGQGIPYFEQLEANHSVKFNSEETQLATSEAIANLEAYIVKEGA
ncbi:transketolase [Breznakia blatticola]|uniref:Transketolase n=1 Tax=Breznakia blatticola TaxID=1754012 RepID=A0A4R7Z8G6_9FIRM|nr:transketolase [Breznakia blatticola]TDW10205.1 transketolase [Breznakia blatticola]